MNVGRCLHVCLQVIGVLRRLPVGSVQPLCPARSRSDRPPQLAPSWLGSPDRTPWDRNLWIGPPLVGPPRIRTLARSDPRDLVLGCAGPRHLAALAAAVLVLLVCAALGCSISGTRRPSVAPALTCSSSRLVLFCFCMHECSLLACLLDCVHAFIYDCVGACVLACMIAISHRLSTLFDRVLDFCLVIIRCPFRFLMPSPSPVLGPTRPHCSRSSTLDGAVLSAFDRLLRVAARCARRWVILALGYDRLPSWVLVLRSMPLRLLLFRRLALGRSGALLRSAAWALSLSLCLAAPMLGRPGTWQPFHSAALPPWRDLVGLNQVVLRPGPALGAAWHSPLLWRSVTVELTILELSYYSGAQPPLPPSLSPCCVYLPLHLLLYHTIFLGQSITCGRDVGF